MLLDLLVLTVAEWHLSNISNKTISYTTKGFELSKKCNGYVFSENKNVTYINETVSFVLFSHVILKFRAKFIYMVEKFKISWYYFR